MKIRYIALIMSGFIVGGLILHLMSQSRPGPLNPVHIHRIIEGSTDGTNWTKISDITGEISVTNLHIPYTKLGGAKMLRILTVTGSGAK